MAAMPHHGHHHDQRHDQGQHDIRPSTADSSLPEAKESETVDVPPNGTFILRAYPVRKRVGDAEVRMLAYDGSIPGPTLRVRQRSEVTIEFVNELNLETTVHWHGLRHDIRFDGVPTGIHHGHQAPVPPGGRFTYLCRFPDPGLFWYHPHIREDYTQEMGLYGNIVVVPSQPDYWPPVDREVTLVLDDLLMEGREIAPFGEDAPPRFGNVPLLNGTTDYELAARRGEVVRLYLTNTANARNFRFAVPGAKLKLVGGDLSRVEHEVIVEEVLISPSERYVIDCLFEQVGSLPIENRASRLTRTLGHVDVSDSPARSSHAESFQALRSNEEMIAERKRAEADFDRSPDKTMRLVGHAIVDPATGDENHAIDWTFQLGDRVKIRIANEPDNMPHPMHFHGQRFLVLSRSGQRNDNLCWKDTVLVQAGETVDILLEATNPGSWMSHCHIAEHLEAHMMFTYHVRDPRDISRGEHHHGGHN